MTTEQMMVLHEYRSIILFLIFILIVGAVCASLILDVWESDDKEDSPVDEPKANAPTDFGEDPFNFK